ncbi:MAG: hypothetical protein NXH75_02765 [Halobacteriovoraceae bacterium]|nr:hypothetical protein [Halobacteriovoraceae bacterium]
MCVSHTMAVTESMEGIEILEVSSSKKSVLLNRGFAEGVRNGDRAKLYLKDLSEGLNFPKFIYIGEGECINVKNKESYWFLRKIKNFRFIRKDQDLVMVRLAKDPRRPFITRRTLRVQGRSKDQEYFQVSEDSGVPEDLIFEENDFFKGDKVKGTKPPKRQDIEMYRETPYVSLADEYDDEFQQLSKSMAMPNDDGDEELINAIEQRAKENVFDSTTKNSVGKFNKLKYGVKSLYKSQIHDGSNTKKGSDFLNLRQERLLKEQVERKVSPGAIARIRKEGPLWSKDMTDKQLRTYLIDTGIAEEVERQKKALREKSGSEFNLRYTSNLTQNTTGDDPNFQSRDYSISVSYEWHLQGTAKGLLDNFTFELEAERGISHFDIGGINSRIQEGSLKGYLNWYLLRPPSSLYSYMPYLGIGYKRGNGTLESAEFDNTYNVQLIGFPSAHFGLKYRFRSGDEKASQISVGYGINFQLKYEQMRYNITDTIVDNIEPVFSGSQLRFSIGLNVYL